MDGKKMAAGMVGFVKTGGRRGEEKRKGKKTQKTVERAGRAV